MKMMKILKSGKKAKIILALALMAIIALAAFTYAWFLNDIEVSGLNMTTGTFKYNFVGYHKTSKSDLQKDFAYSTEVTQDGFDAATQSGFNAIHQDGTLTAVTDTSNIITDVSTSGELYYVVHKLDKSIDLDVRINVNADLSTLKDFNTLEGSAVIDPASREAIGGFWYSVSDVTGSVSDIIQNGESALGAIERHIQSNGVFNDTRYDYFPSLRDNAWTKARLDTNDYMCFKVSYGLNENVSVGYENKTIDLSVSICVAQINGFEDEDGGETLPPVRTLEDLKDQLLSYRPNDTITIQGDILYEGDIVLNRPLTLKIVGSTLTIKGNLRYAYDSKGDFTINTAAAGKLEILQMDEEEIEAGGNFYIDAPESTVKLIGRYSEAKGEADIYVEKVFSAEVSHDTGLFIMRSRICDTTESEKLKTIYLRQDSTLEVDLKTTIGTVMVHNAKDSSMRAARVHIINKGTIEEINLINMDYVVGAPGNPRIFIDNYGNIERNGEPTPIRLPTFASKWYEDVPGSPLVSNTRIIRQQGAGEMSVYGTNQPFRTEHIEYKERDTLVEFAPDNTHIRVHYMENEYFITKDAEGKVMHDDTTLKNIIEYYLPDGKVDNDAYKTAELENIVSLTVICYNKYTITPADYEFIRTMSGLVTLDLTNADSMPVEAEGGTVPDNALAGLSNLTTAILPDADKNWGSKIFYGTAITEISFPTQLASITSETLLVSEGKNISFVHVGTKADLVIDSGVDYSETYLFCADDGTREKFISAIEAKNNSTEKYKERISDAPSATNLNKIDRIFLEAERYGDYYVSLYDRTCMIVTHVGSSFDPVKEKTGYYHEDGRYYKFDFATFTIGEDVYQVSAYDDFAFYGKSLLRWDENSLVFSESLDSIGDYAFWNVTLPKNVDLGKCRILGHGGIANNAKLDILTAHYLESAGYWAFGNLTGVRHIDTPRLIWHYGRLLEGNANLVRFDSGVLQLGVGDVDHTKKVDGSSAIGYYVNYDSTGMIVQIVHTDNVPENITNMAKYRPADGYTYAPKHLIVPDAYASYYTALGKEGTANVINIGDYTADDLRIMADDVQSFGAYIYLPLNDNDEYKLLACIRKTAIDGMADKFSDKNGTFIIPAYIDEDGYKHPTTILGTNAFGQTQLVRTNTLTLDDSYLAIGSGGFYPRFGGKHTYATLDLNKVQVVGYSATRGVPAITIVGTEVTTIDTYNIMDCANVVAAYFPKFISHSDYGVSTAVWYLFQNCKNLKTVAVGPIDGGRYIFASTPSVETIYVNMYNIPNAPATVDFGGNFKGKMICIGGDLNWEKSYNNNNDLYEKVIIDGKFEDVVFSEWTDTAYNMKFGDMTKQYYVSNPGFLYLKQSGTNELKLAYAFAPAEIKQDTYALPDTLYYTEGDTVRTVFGTVEPRYTYVGGEGKTSSGMHVTSLADGIYKDLLKVNSVIFPSEIRSIGISTFEGCTLGDISINGNGQSTIGEKAFYNAQIGSIILDGFKEIGISAFEECALDDVTIRDGVETEILERAFYGAKIKHLTLDSVKSIGDYAFYGIEGKSASSAKIGTAVQLGADLASIGESAFETAVLKTVISSYSEAYPIELVIGTKAFRAVAPGTSETLSIDFAEAFVIVGEYAFESATLNNVGIPNMRRIDAYAFNTATISGTLDLSGNGGGVQPTIMPYAFKGASSLKRMTIGTVLLGDNTLLKGDFGIKNGAMSGSDGSQVYYGAFTDCYITTIDFNDAIQPEALAFVRCGFGNMYFGNMKAVGVSVQGTGVINYASNQSTDHPYMVNTNGVKVDNTAWTKFIFRDCTGYGNMYFENVTAIGSYVFGKNNSVTNINSIDFGEVKSMGLQAFKYIAFKEDVVFGEGTSIDAQSFHTCTFEKDVFFGDELILSSYSFIYTNFNGTLSFGSFSNSSSNPCFASTSNYGKTINNIEFRDTCSSIPDKAFALMRINEIDFTNITSIGSKAFANSIVGTIKNMSGIVTISSNAFGMYDTGKSFTISPSIGSGLDMSNVTTVGNSAFQGNTINQDVDLSAATSLGTAIFKNATVNGDITLGDRTAIPANLFEGATVNGTIDMSKITSIASNAFKNAKLSQDMAFGSAISIAENAFVGATVPSVKFSGGSIAAQAFANSNIGVLQLGTVESIAGATPTKADDGTISGDDTGSFYKATIGEIYIENASDPAALSFAYATIGVLDYGNLTKTGLTSGANTDGFSSPFYGVDQIDRINFGKLQTIGQYYFKGVTIGAIGVVNEDGTVSGVAERVKDIRTYAFRNCSISGDLIFNSLVKLSERCLAYVDVFGDMKFNAGISAGENLTEIEGAYTYVIYSCKIYEDMYIDNLNGDWNTNFDVLKSTTVMGKFTINSGKFKGGITNSYFRGTVDFTGVDGVSSSNGVFADCEFSTNVLDLRSMAAVTHATFFNCIFPEGTVVYLDEATSIGRRAFQSSVGITNIIAPNVTTVDAQAFQGCTSLKSISLPSIKTFTRNNSDDKNSPFYNCSTLTSVLLGENFTSCTGGYVLFPDTCKALEQVILLADPENVTFGTTMGLPNGAKLVVPYTMKDKYDALIAADDDGKLWGSVTAGSIETIEKVLHDGSISYLVTEIGDGKIEIVDVIDDGTMLLGTTFAFPSTLGDYTVASIGGLAISRLNGIVTVVLPSTLEYINFSGLDSPVSVDGYAFATIENYSIDSSNPYFASVDGILYSKDLKTLVLYPVARSGEITLADHVTIIGERAFAGCVFLEKIVIHQSVVIADNAFERCISLTDVVFTSEQASIFIGRDVFLNCGAFTGITVPAGFEDAYRNMIFYDTNVKIKSAS